MYGLVLNTAATIEPVSLDEAKRQCGIAEAIGYHDETLTRHIKTAREMVERLTGRQLINATWDLVLDGFPSGAQPIKIPKNPLSSVTSITYLDSDGVSQTWTSSNYRVTTSKEPATVSLAYQVSYPATRGIEGSVTVRFVAGYGSTMLSVPGGLRDLVLMFVEQLYTGTEIPESTLRAMAAGYSVGEEFTCYAEAT
jgi:uncharacterized phiE125 gp8 family phage protein